jgi:hypothetical protein
MDSPENSLLILATTAGPVLVQGSGTELVLRGDTQAITRWADARSDSPQLSLWLDGIQGTHDATALHVSMRRLEADGPSTAGRETLLGTAALYGLRLASVAGSRQGLTLHLDITAHAARLRPLLLASVHQPLTLAMEARPVLPAGVTISITRVCVASPREDAVGRHC